MYVIELPELRSEQLEKEQNGNFKVLGSIYAKIPPCNENTHIKVFQTKPYHSKKDL